MYCIVIGRGKGLKKKLKKSMFEGEEHRGPMCFICENPCASVRNEKGEKYVKRTPVWVCSKLHRLNKLTKEGGVIHVFTAHGLGKRSTQGTHTGAPYQDSHYAV